MSNVEGPKKKREKIFTKRPKVEKELDEQSRKAGQEESELF